ncbi:MAG: MotA/TolQ/ExbB proton channel family protein [Pseudomonadota bacterium]
MLTKRWWYGVIGVLLASALIFMEFPHSWLFFNLPGLLLVLGGTVAAGVLSYSLDTVKRVLVGIPALLQEHHPPAFRDGERLLRINQRLRRGDLRSAEEDALRITDPFLKSGVQSVLDGIKPDELQRTLERRVHQQQAHSQTEVQVLRTLAGFAPAFGMLGTLLGLVQMLGGLSQVQMGEIGTHMSFAFVNTLYGILAANAFFRPLAIKRENRAQQEMVMLGFGCDLISVLQERQNSAALEELCASPPFESLPDRPISSSLLSLSTPSTKTLIRL